MDKWLLYAKYFLWTLGMAIVYASLLNLPKAFGLYKNILFSNGICISTAEITKNIFLVRPRDSNVLFVPRQNLSYLSTFKDKQTSN